MVNGSCFSLVCALVVGATVPASGDVALLLGAPYGRNAKLNPTGHVALYLSGVCADEATRVRPCRAGEPGVVISRYHRVGDVDWAAVPLIPYLYAVESIAEVPARATQLEVAGLRDAYRRRHLRQIAPDGPSGDAPRDNWWQLVGAAYDRRIVAFVIQTTDAQDAELIRWLDSRPNRSRFNLFFRNCADFVRDVVHVYHPGVVRSNVVADLGFTTPKHVAKSLVKFSAAHPEVGLRSFLIPQIPGSQPRNHGTRGVLEALVKTKKYVVPLALYQPWVPAGFAAAYLVGGRFNPERHATAVLSPFDVEVWLHGRPVAPGRSSGIGGAYSVPTALDVVDRDGVVPEDGAEVPGR